MKYLMLVLLFGTFRVISADMTKAYGLYLTGKYDSAYSYYNSEYQVNTENIDAVYGMVNCQIAMKNYETALKLIHNSIEKYQNGVLYSKLIYIYGLKNDVKKALQTFDTAKKLFTETSLPDSSSYITGNELSDLLYSAGCGFYDGEKFRTAMEWFSMGDSLFNDISIFKQAVNNTKVAIKNQYIISTNFNGGILAYSSNLLYENGNFFSGSLSALFKQRYRVKTAYTRTDIRFHPIYYGINYDTLYASSSGNPEASGYKIISSRPLNNNGKRDTLYYVYTETITSNSNTSFDTIVTYMPQNYYQNDYYLSLTEYGRFLKKTDITAGCRISLTNMSQANNLNTFFLNHTTTISSFNLGCSYYASFLDHDQIYQFSPHVEFAKGLFFFGLTFNTVSPPLGKNRNSLYEDVQLSSDLLLGLKFKTLKLSVTGSLGNKKFLNGAEGEIINNVLYDHKYGFGSLIEWTPRNKGLTLYQLSNFSKSTYNQNEQSEFTKFVIMGGIYIQW